jgi:hypothetical protein
MNQHIDIQQVDQQQVDIPMNQPMAKKAKMAYFKYKPKTNITKDDMNYNPDPSPTIIHFLRPEKRFNILPQKAFHNIISIYADMLPVSCKGRAEYIEKHFPLSSPFAGMKPPFFLPIDTINTGWSKEKSIAIRRATICIMKHRFAFKKLLQHMRCRRLQRANKEDIFTGEECKYPVQIVSWAEKRVYTFEAYTIMKDITERLLHFDGFFEDPQSPRNPFTNIPLTQSQTISVWNSVSRAGIPVSSAFTLYRNSRFCIKAFIEENSIFLKLNSLRRTFNEAKSYDYTDRMLNFIEYCYNIESIECALYAFRNAITNYPNHHIIKKWSALCKKYYEPDILYIGNTATINRIKEAVLDDTYALLHLQRELVSLNIIVENIPHDPVIFDFLSSLDFSLVDV